MVSVLVVEDDEVSRELIASRLERAGHDVRSAPSAPAARRLMADLVPDVLVSDMFMPGGSALALVTDLRAARDTADLPVVLLSGRALPADVEAGAALGCAYLRKPFAVRTLLEAVDAAADQPSRGVEAGVLRRLAELGDLDDPAERDLFARLLTSCAEQLVAGLAQLTRLVRAHDRGGVEDLAHRLAGTAANVGADRVSRSLREVEASAARGRLLEQADLQALRGEVPVAQRALAGVAHSLTAR